MKTILSIDGGGIRGIIPLACLVKLERREGKPAPELFEMVAGTSTGSVIAAGLALGLTARGLLALYKDLARQAFKKLPWWQVLGNLGNHRYSNAFIAATLDAIGADVALNELPIQILITAKNTLSSRTDFFVRDGPGNAALWGTMRLKDAVLASIAAPTYFPAHHATVLGKSHTWVDGGVGVAGNPAYHAAVEALHYTAGGFQPGETRMLSFGTGRHPHPIEADKANLLQWARWSLDEILEDTGDWQTFVTRQEYDMSGEIDFRRYQLDLAQDVMQLLDVDVPQGLDVGSIGLDDVWAIELLEAIGQRFAARIDFDDPAGLELETSGGW